jgi:5-methylcytosine-specific restriction endonuclease McrA
MYKLEPYHRNVSEQALIEDVISVATKLNVEKLTIDQYNEHGLYHSTTLTRRFGSWFTVLDKCELKRTRNLNITNESLFENLSKIWIETGSQPKYGRMTKDISLYSAGTYEYRFGTWRKSLEAFVVWANEGIEYEVDSIPAVRNVRRTPKNSNWRLRALVLMRDSARCQLCGATPQNGVRLHVDHIHPWSKGGETVLENLRILCEQCNIGKSDIVIESEVTP